MIRVTLKQKVRKAETIACSNVCFVTCFDVYDGLKFRQRRASSSAVRCSRDEPRVNYECVVYGFDRLCVIVLAKSK